MTAPPIVTRRVHTHCHKFPRIHQSWTSSQTPSYRGEYYTDSLVNFQPDDVLQTDIKNSLRQCCSAEGTAVLSQPTAYRRYNNALEEQFRTPIVNGLIAKNNELQRRLTLLETELDTAINLAAEVRVLRNKLALEKAHKQKIADKLEAIAPTVLVKQKAVRTAELKANIYREALLKTLGALSRKASPAATEILHVIQALRSVAKHDDELKDIYSKLLKQYTRGACGRRRPPET